MTVDTSEMHDELAALDETIAKMEGRTSGDEMAKYFHLGRVGGSGWSSGRIKARNKANEREDAVRKKLLPLYEKRNHLAKFIEGEESGENQARRDAREKNRVNKENALALWWSTLKKGDQILMGNGSITVARKNKKSISTTDGNRWTAQELTGKEPEALAALLEAIV